MKQKTSFEKLITDYQQTGICTIDVEKVCKAWTDKFIISQYHDEYSLIKFLRGENKYRVSISKDQALEVINKAELAQVKSDLFKYAWTYKKAGFIQSEIIRLNEILKEERMKVSFIESSIIQLEQALKV